MSDVTPSVAAESALFWGAVGSSLKTVTDEARGVALKALSEAQIGSQRVLDASGVDLGTVSWTPPSAGSPALTDEVALLAWVKRNRPDEVVTVETVRSSYVNALIANAQLQPEQVPILDDGTVVPGITVPESASLGRLTVRPTPEAKRRVRELMQNAVGALRNGEGLPGLPEGLESV